MASDNPTSGLPGEGSGGRNGVAPGEVEMRRGGATASIDRPALPGRATVHSEHSNVPQHVTRRREQKHPVVQLLLREKLLGRPQPFA